MLNASKDVSHHSESQTVRSTSAQQPLLKLSGRSPNSFQYPCSSFSHGRHPLLPRGVGCGRSPTGFSCQNVSPSEDRVLHIRRGVTINPVESAFNLRGSNNINPKAFRTMWLRVSSAQKRQANCNPLGVALPQIGIHLLSQGANP